MNSIARLGSQRLNQQGIAGGKATWQHLLENVSDQAVIVAIGRYQKLVSEGATQEDLLSNDELMADMIVNDALESDDVGVTQKLDDFNLCSENLRVRGLQTRVVQEDHFQRYTPA
jgi:hypothetical protein